MIKLITAETFYRLSERRKRISFDVDRHHLQKEPLKVLRIFFTLKNCFPYAKITVHRTAHGFHVKAVNEKIADIPLEKRVSIRETLGDDYPRVEYDKLKIRLGLPYFVDTLFSTKFYPNGTIGHEEKCNPIALPWISKIPSKKG